MESKAQTEAKTYIDKHKLEQLIGEMLNSLVHAKDPHPVIFMIKYLCGLCKEDELAQNGITIKINEPQPNQLVKFPTFPEACNSLLKKHLSRETWDRLINKKTKYGNDFYSSVRVGVEHVEHEVGVLALDEDAFVQFEPLFSSIAEDLHSWKHTHEHKSNKIVLVDPSLVPLLQVRFSRNFKGIVFPTGMDKKQRTDTEAQVRQCLEELGGSVSPIDTLRDTLKLELASKMITVEKPNNIYESSAANKNWPDARSVWSNGNVFARLNFIDHLEVFSINENGDLKSAFDQAQRVLEHCEQKPFAKNQIFGFLTADLTNLGCALQLKAKLNLPNANPAAVLKCGATSNVGVVAKEDGCFEATLSCLGKSEADLLSEFVAFLRQVTELNELIFEGNTLLTRLVSKEIRKTMLSRSILSVYFRDLLVCDESAEVGLIAKHAQCYSGFREAFEPIINHLHGMGMVELNADANFEDVIDLGLFQSSKISFSRNIAGDIFVPGLNSAQRKAIMAKIRNVLDARDGQFWDLEKATKNELQKLNQYFPTLGGDYSYTQLPHGRGVWISEDTQQIVIINFRDHIEVIGLANGSSLKNAYIRCLNTLETLSVLGFESHPYFGYLTTSPKDIGSGMKASVYIKVPLALEELESWAAENKLAVKAVSDTRIPEKIYEISTTQKLRPNEGEVLKSFVASLQELVEWKQKLVEAPQSFESIAGITEANRSLLVVTVGNPPNADCPTRFSFEVRLGGERTAEVVRSIEGKMQMNTGMFLPCIVLECESEEKARELEEIVRKIWEQGENGSFNFLSTLHLHTQLEVTVLDSAVILKFSLNQIFRQRVEDYFDTLFAQAKEAFAQETAISVEITAGERVDEVVNSQNAIEILCNSIRVKLEFTLWKGLSAFLSNISTMTVPASIIAAFAFFGVYRNARLEMNFNSLQDLPESAKTFVPDSRNLNALINIGKSFLIDEELELLRTVAKTVRSTAHLCAKGKFLAVCGSARLVGIGELLESE